MNYIESIARPTKAQIWDNRVLSRGCQLAQSRAPSRHTRLSLMRKPAAAKPFAAASLWKKASTHQGSLARRLNWNRHADYDMGRATNASYAAQLVHRFPDGGVRLRSGNAIDQRSFGAEALAGLGEPRFLAGRERSTATLCQHIPNRGGQRGRLADLTTCPQLSRPFPGIGRQALSRRVQANRDASTPLVRRRSPTRSARLTGTSSVPPSMSWMS